MSELPKISVGEIVEHDDGSATITIDFDADAHRLLVQEGFLSLLRSTLKDMEETHETD